MSERRTAPVRRHLRGGSVYLATLGAAMIVTVIGLSALLVARIQHQVSQGAEAAVKARYYAISVIDLAQFWISSKPTWRSALASGVWTPVQTAGEVTYCYKLVDEQDGLLADDASEPVRLYAKATVGQAVRICSVLLQPPDFCSSLLSNGDMEIGTVGWLNSGYCKLEPCTGSDAHGGVGYVRVKSRDGYWAGPRQDVRDKIASGAAYYTEVWLKMKDAPEGARIRLYVNSTNGGSRWFDSATATIGQVWTRLSGTITPTWTGLLTEAYWKVETTTTKQEFRIDDAIFLEGAGSPAIKPGTWRQEVIP